MSCVWGQTFVQMQCLEANTISNFCEKLWYRVEEITSLSKSIHIHNVTFLAPSRLAPTKSEKNLSCCTETAILQNSGDLCYEMFLYWVFMVCIVLCCFSVVPWIFLATEKLVWLWFCCKYHIYLIIRWGFLFCHFHSEMEGHKWNRKMHS
jgi:hypothetical protein